MLLSLEESNSNIGSLVTVSMNSKLCPEDKVPAWKDFPGEYGFHKKVYLVPGFGILLDHKDTFYQVLTRGHKVWIEFYWIRKLS